MRRTGTEPLHPLLASRPRRYLLAAAMIAVGAIAVGFGYSALDGNRALMPIASADAQQTGSGAGPAGTTGETDGRQARVEAPEEVRNSVARQASGWGIDACLGQIVILSDFLTAGSSYSALSQRGRTDADRQMFTATISAQDRSGLNSITTMASAPVANGCNSTYQTVAAFPMSCEETHAAHFAGFAEELEFGGSVSVHRNPANGLVYLLPLDDVGCTAVKTEVLY